MAETLVEDAGKKKKSRTTILVAGGVVVLLVVYLFARRGSSSATSTTIAPVSATSSTSTALYQSEVSTALVTLQGQIETLDYAVAGMRATSGNQSAPPTATAPSSTTGTQPTTATAPAPSSGPSYTVTRGKGTASLLTPEGAGLSIGHYKLGSLFTRSGTEYVTQHGIATATAGYESHKLSYYLSPGGTFEPLASITSYETLEHNYPGTTTYQQA